MITKRDQDIYNFLDEDGLKFHTANSNQIHEIFFKNTSYRYSRKRLQYLYSIGFLKRTRSTISNDFAYYIDKKSYISKIHHDLIRTELYVNLIKYHNVLEWNNESSIVNIRPDAITYINDNDIVFPVFIEIHLNNQFNFDKYIKFIKDNDLTAIYGRIPRVIICTDRKVKIQNMNIKFKVIDFTTMKGLDSLFK